MNSMKGKRVIITGPTSGIGKEIAWQLGSLGADLVLGCRDITRRKQTAAEIRQSASSANIDVMYIDTSSLQSIQDFANQVRAKYSRLDVLVNNAGVNRTGQARRTALMALNLLLPRTSWVTTS